MRKPKPFKLNPKISLKDNVERAIVYFLEAEKVTGKPKKQAKRRKK